MRWQDGIWLALAAALVFGCEQQTTAEGDGGGAGGAVADGGGGAPGDGAVDGPDGGPDPDDGVPRDRGVVPDMRGPDMAVPPVESCQDACDRYSACERLDVWGDEGACLAACERSAQRNDLSGWFACVQQEACGLIQLCRLPAPAALSCAEACAAAEGCGVDLPFADCEAECQALEAGPALRACAESLVGACDAAGFRACLAQDVFPTCGARCERTVACNLERAETCLTDCLATAADADPLRRVRHREANQCVGLAGMNCERVNACLTPDAPPLANEAEACRLYRGCGFEDFFPCDEIIDAFFGGQAPPGFLECVVQQLQVCPEDPFFLLERCANGGGPVGPTCLDLCNDLATCGALPEGFDDAFACNQSCNEERAGTAEQRARAEARVACGRAASCGDLAACLEAADPANACADLCDALAGCDAAPADCEARCQAEAFRDRWQAAFACRAEAGVACEAVAACAPGAPLGCDAFCERRLICGRGGLDRAGCLGDCDNADFADPARQRERLACVLTAPLCDDVVRGHAVDVCLSAPEVGGRACLGACRLANACQDEADVIDCLDACGDGRLGTGPTVAYLAGQTCFASDPNGDCAALGDCPPAGPADCAAWCDAQVACGLPRPDCEARCAADPLATLRAHTQGACLADADGDCGAVRACVTGGVDDRVDTSQANFCRLYQRCGARLELPCEDFYNIARQEGGDGDAVVACMIRSLEAGCPEFEWDLFEQCIEQGRGVDPRRARCDALCDLRGLCEGLGPDADLRACKTRCALDFGPNGAPEAQVRRAEAALACDDAWTCAELNTCVAESAPETQCQRFCDARLACGADLDRAECLAACGARFDYDRATAWRGCVRQAGEDCAAVAACRPPPAPDCSDWCATGRRCGLVGDDCERACDDADFADRNAFAVRQACARLDMACFDNGRDQAALEACYVGDPLSVIGTSCQSYCRAVTDCDPQADRPYDRCVFDCVVGFQDAEGLVFGAAAQCFAQVGAQAPCAPLQACLPAEPPAVDCAAFCQAQAGCGFDVEGCQAACQAAPDRDAAGCVAEAARTGAGCRAVATCAGVPLPEIPSACTALCLRQAECGAQGDRLRCELACLDAGDAAPIRAACAEITGCAQQVACANLPAALEPGCAAPCAGLLACGAYVDAAACQAECTGLLASPAAPARAEALACLAGVGGADGPCGPDDVRACFDPFGSLCAEACGLFPGCNIDVDGDCVASCQQAAVEDPGFDVDSLRCIIAALRNNCDINRLEGCVGQPVDPDPPPIPEPVPPPDAD